MEKPFNWFAQGVADGALRKTGVIAFEHPVASGDLAIDIWFQPDPGLEALRCSAGLLGRLASVVCVIDPFSEAPRLHHVNDCIARVFLLHRLLRRRARGDRAGDEDASKVAVPRLVMVSAGRPETAMVGWAMAPMCGGDWPASGLYASAAPSGPWLVVVPELPRTRDTLLVRMMGRDETLRAAIDDLDALEADAPERHIVAPLLRELKYDRERMGLVLKDKESGMIRWAEIRDRVWKEEDERVAREQAMIERERVLSEKIRVAEEQVRNAEEQVRNAEEQVRNAEEQARYAEEQARYAEEQARNAEEQARYAEEQARTAQEHARTAEEHARSVKEQARAAAEKAFARLCERRLKRPLRAPEHARLAAHVGTFDLEALAERIADLDDDALAAWLANEA